MNKLGANRSLPTTVCVLLFHRTAEMFIGDYLTYPFHCRPFEANIFSSNLRESRREKFGRVQALHSRPNHTGCTWLELLNLVSCYRPRVNSRNDRDEFAGPLNVVIRTYLYVGTYTGRPLLPGRLLSRRDSSKACPFCSIVEIPKTKGWIRDRYSV